MLTYKYNGRNITWIPGVGTVRPGQVFTSRYPLTGNPLIVPDSGEATPVGEVKADDNVCTKCVRVKNSDKKAKKKE